MEDIKKWLFESAKLIGRWVLFFVISWFIGETLKQKNLVPEFYELKVSVFTYLIPVRQLFVFGLTAAGGFVDKFLHEWGKATEKTGWLGIKGLSGF